MTAIATAFKAARIVLSFKLIPWGLVGIFGLLLIAASSEISRLKLKFDDLSRYPYADHRAVRVTIIRLLLADALSPIVVYGDSVTEMAKLPDAVCGHPVVNAGVGGATIAELTHLAGRVFDGTSPFMIVAAVGANDTRSENVSAALPALGVELRKHANEILLVPSTNDRATLASLRASSSGGDLKFISLPVEDLLDGVHMSKKGYDRWIPSLISTIASSCVE